MTVLFFSSVFATFTHYFTQFIGEGDGRFSPYFCHLSSLRPFPPCNFAQFVGVVNGRFSPWFCCLSVLRPFLLCYFAQFTGEGNGRFAPSFLRFSRVTAVPATLLC
ncbi:MAG: hypothetical protein KC421_01985, partial [Anaerolineales bacterium]|nr:hypothetical protein [Anaerolineales bacterium]